MDTDLKNKWIEALRSGNYEQGPDQLVHTLPEEFEVEETFCCLGVLADLMGDVEREGDYFLFPLDGIDLNILLWDDEDDRLMGPSEWQGDNDEMIRDNKIVAETMIPAPVADQLGLRTEVPALDFRGEPTTKELRNELANMNDSRGKNFDEIADFLESIDF